jgi:hypothetical protein
MQAKPNECQQRENQEPALFQPALSKPDSRQNEAREWQ